MTAVVCSGLDGSNPLAFFAALGTLRILDARARAEHSGVPRLFWADEGRWVAGFHGPSSIEEIAQAVLADLAGWADDPVLTFAYSKAGERVPPNAKGAIRDLKPPPLLARRWLAEIANEAASGERRSADTVAALLTDVAVDGKGNAKPTAFHFTAGQQTFLKMAAELQAGVRKTDFMEAFEGPWQGVSRLPSFSWNSTSARIYALRASDPSAEKRGSVAGAEWLALVGLACLPVMPKGRSVFTTGVTGRWKDSVFTWPIWDVPAALPTIRSLLSWDQISGETPVRHGPTWQEKMRIRGVSTLLRSSITRAEPGGYGAFSPAEVVWATERTKWPDSTTRAPKPASLEEIQIVAQSQPAGQSQSTEQSQPVATATEGRFWQFE